MDDPEKLDGLLDQCNDSSAKQFANAPSLICFSCSDSNPFGMQNRGDPDGVQPHGSNLDKGTLESKAGSSSKDSQKKDRKALKRPRTAYQIFIGAECERLKKIPGQSLGLNFRQKAIDAWNCLNNRGRMPYIEESKREREQFRQEVVAYTDRQIGQAGKTIHETESEPNQSTSDIQKAEPVIFNGMVNTINAELNGEGQVSHTSNIQTEETSHAQQLNDEYHVSLQLEEPDKLPEPDESMLEFAFKMMENAKMYNTPFQIDLGEFLSVP
ncbi:hypothetical protein MKX01_010155 [Papaver californicum]|nr:hypothetical protein MKX01_010155 [Papaver californicum]